MRTTSKTLAVIATVAALTSACGTQPKPGTPDAANLPAVQDSAAAAAPSDGAPAGSNAQGRIPKKLGEAAGFTGQDGKTQAVTFSIDKITVDPKCDEYMNRAAGTHTLVLDVRVATEQLSPEDAAQLGATINPFAFQTVADGVTAPVNAGSCKVMSLKRLPNTWASNSKYTGQIELEVPAKSGTLALIPGGLTNAGGGWEWSY